MNQILKIYLIKVVFLVKNKLNLKNAGRRKLKMLNLIRVKLKKIGKRIMIRKNRLSKTL